jgi:Sec-independent protein translocase protein TatA
MDFLGIGPLEIILILILGLLFFGPEKLPGMAAKAARLYRNFRRSTYELTRDISEEINTEIRKEEQDLKSLVDPTQFEIPKPASPAVQKPSEPEAEKTPDE